MLDSFGLEVTSATAENILLVNQSAELLFRKKAGIDKLLPSSANMYPECAVLQIYTGIMYFFSFSSRTISKELPISLQRIRTLKLNSRETLHFEALQAIANYDLIEAMSFYLKLVSQFPQDKVAILMVETCGFLSGKIEGLFIAYDELYPHHLDDPDFLGMYAFLLTHNNQLADARMHVEKALQLTPNNAWVQHVYAHTIDETNLIEISQGIQFLNRCAKDWPLQNRFFEGHNWMHLCGLHFKSGNCDFTEILRVYSKHIWGEAREFGFEQNNAFWVVWQARLNGYAEQIPQELRADLARYAEPFMTDYVTPYLTITAILSVAQFDLAKAQVGIESLMNYIDTLPVGSYRHCAWQDIGLLILNGCLDYLKGNYKGAYEKLAPVINKSQAMGHSDEQRIIFSETLVSAKCYINQA